MRMAILTLVLLIGGTARADEPFFFQKNDRIMFLGDSITEQYEYSSFIELYLTTRFPDWKLTFLNAGIGGDTAHGGSSRFKAHILDEKPTALTINFGMNDGGYGAFDPKRNEVYVTHTRMMLEQAKASGIRTALLSPNAVDPRVQQRFVQYLETQKQFYAPLKSLAQEQNAAFVDQYAVTRAVLEKLAADKADAVKPFGDGFHTSSPGGLLMAHTILTGLKAPAVVSGVQIEVGKSDAKTERCTVSALATKPTEVTFERLDEALPMPIQPEWVSLLPYLDELKNLNYYGLKVTGLTGEKFTLSIDGKPVGTFTAKQLAEGVNLGNLTTGPLHEQGQKVFAALKSKNQQVHQRFRGVMMASLPDWAGELTPAFNERRAKELAARREKIDQLQAGVYALTKPVKHTFQLTATP